VIEDDPNVAFAYRMMFEHYDYRVIIVDNPSAVMNAMDKTQFDAVICDLVYAGAMNEVRDIVHVIRSVLRDTSPILVVSDINASKHSIAARQNS